MPLLFKSTLIEVVETTGNVLFECRFPLRMPATQGRSTFDEVASSPFYPEAVEILRRGSWSTLLT